MSHAGSGGIRLLLSVMICASCLSRGALAQCGAPPNQVVAENCLTGNPESEWDISYSDQAGDPSIQGFATDISVNIGQTIYFKIKTPATSYTIDVYRMGYYGGMGARKVASVAPSAHLPQTQPACLTDASTRLYDCGNWSISASWAVPSNATSGIYFAHLIRSDTRGDSHIVFVVRNDVSHSSILFQTSDETWQAYNAYGGSGLYGGPDTFTLPTRAYKVSYNRPFNTRGFQEESASFVFGGEYPTVRFLEANGYDVTYFTGVDAARYGSLIKNHKIYLCVGHDEYWSGPHRANVEAALAAGVNMAFLSGNEVFWKTRWEDSIDGTNTPYRTLVCYKETLNLNSSDYITPATDPQDPPTWTGTWRDSRFSPPADGGVPENALTGTIFMVNGPGDDNPGSLAIQVPAADGKMRFWRNTAVASQSAGSAYTLAAGTLGYEWDEDLDNGFRPAGAFQLSTTTHTLTTDLNLDFGANYGAGTATHHLMMHRSPSGALVFGAGTIQWVWGLDANHDNPFANILPNNPPADPNMQQATVNLFADMGVQPATLQSGLVPAAKSTDGIPPVSTIGTPASGTTLSAGIVVTIAGTASDSGGGVVGGVEVSVDGGATWHPAVGRATWSYSWTPSVTGTAIIESRAVDDSGNIETPTTSHSVTVVPQSCPCGAFGVSTAPATPDSGDPDAVELGVKFKVDVLGYVTGIRFYKSANNTGTHVGSLWSDTGTLLATATFASETGSGWQQVTFSTPVPVSPGTTYVASYFAPVGHYSADSWFFYKSGVDDPPIHLLANGLSPNGVYAYGSASSYPSSTSNATNYWVDVIFAPSTVNLSPSSLSFGDQLIGTSSTPQTVTVSNVGNSTVNLASITITGLNSADFTQTNTCGPTLAVGQNCTITVTFTPTGSGIRSATVTITDSAPASPQTISLTGSAIVAQPPPGTCPCSVWNMSVTPATIDSGDSAGVEVGVKFTSDQNGLITGIRYYKSAANTGTHIGNLWTASGTRLATVTFSNEGISGWQQATFSSPVPVTANTTYIASYYAPGGHYSATAANFLGGLDSPPLHVVSDGVTPNGVYTYGTQSSLPQSSYNATNYWVDVVFMPSTVSLAPESLSFANQVVGTNSPVQPVVLSNNGTTPVAISSIAITGANNADFSQTNTCGTSIAAGASCTINVTFAPVTTGSRSATLAVTDNIVGSPQMTSLTGTGVAPAASLSAASLAFGSQVVGGTSPPQAIILSNTGNATLNVTSITIGGTNGGDFAQISTCGTSLAVGDNCIVSITFTPTAAGARDASLIITDNASGSPHTVGLTGTGLATPPPPGVCPCSIWSLTSAPVVVDSGDSSGVELGVKFISDQDGWVTGVRFYKSAANTGTHIGNLWNASGTRLATVTFSSESDSGWQQMNFSSPVQIMANTTYVVSYYAPAGHYSVNGIYFVNSGVDAPPLHAVSNRTSANGVFSYGSASSFPQSDYNASNYWVDVVFTPTRVQFSPSSLSFGGQSVGTSSPAQQVALTNTGSTTLNLTSISITGANSGDFSQTNTCAASLVAGASCSINVTFAPTADGVRSAALSISDDAIGSPHTAILTGAGSDSAVTLVPTSLSFPSILVGGSSAVQTVTLSNTGSATLGLASIAITGPNSGDFTQTNTCGTSVAAAARCLINVTFTPTALGSRTATITISDDAPGNPHTAGLIGTGVSTPPPPNTCPCSIWGPATVPATPDNGDSASLEIGVKFTSDRDGYIAGVKFYKSASNIGTHIGNLWTSAGTLLATATFTGETASGWQQVNFGSPVPITANTTYVASYYAPLGHYAAEGAYFASAADNAPLHAIANGVDVNGVYAYGAASSFPQSSFNATNYWVDVVMVSTTVTVSPSTLSFSQTLGGTSAPQQVTLTNSGLGTLGLTGISVTGSNAADFGQTNTCGTTLAPGASCTINVTFTPSLTGPESAAISISDDGAGTPQTVALTATGVGTDPTVGLSPTSLTFSNTTVGTTSAAQAITLSNSGSGTLSITSIAITGANSSDFAQTNTCGGNLAGGASCSISVTFKPTVSGARSASVMVTDNASGSPHAVVLGGTGIASAVGLSPTALTFSNTTVGATSAAQTITLSNTGNASLNIASIAITGTNNGDFAQTNTCGTSVAAGANCTISVTFKPTATGTRTAVVTVTDDANGNPHTAGLSGTGVAPAASLNPTSLTFASTAVGTTSPAQTITLSNTGNGSLSVTSIAITGTNNGDFAQTNTCGTSVAAGANCTISVTFKPTATGTRTATVTVTDNAAGSPHTASLTGTGGAPVASLNPTSLTFANTTLGATSAAQTIRLSNTGTASLSITSIAIGGTNSGDFAQTNNCGTSVAAAANCTISVTFKPTATGTRTGTLTVTDNAAGSPHTANLTGTGVAPVAGLSPTSLTFANTTVGATSAAQTIRLSNTGTASLSITSIAIAGTNSGDFAQTNNCGTSVAAGANCTISVTFKPTATGARGASVTVTDNAAGSPQTANLTGTGVAPVATLSPTSLSFGTVAIGATTAGSAVTLRNTGTATMNLTGITITGTNSADFSQSNNCGSTLAVNASCTMTVRFSPKAAGTRSAAVSVSDNATGSPQTVSLSGTGTAVSVSPTALNFGSQIRFLQSSPQSVTLRNLGSTSLTISSISITGTNAADFSQTNGCGSRLGGGSSCTVSVRFRPSARGTRTANLTIADTDPTSPQNVALSGTGL